ncbi:MAG: VIT domain-containing protein [Planctomycetota bacterium]
MSASRSFPSPIVAVLLLGASLLVAACGSGSPGAESATADARHGLTIGSELRRGYLDDAQGAYAAAPSERADEDVLARLSPGEELWVIDRAGLAAAAPGDEIEPGCGRCFGRRDVGETVPLPLEKTKVRADVAGHVATVDVTQVFHNPFDTKIEAIYVFPLPHDAAVSEFVMTIGERRIRGVVRRREEAERIYEAARSMGYVAALLSQERPNVFTQSVANIEPGRRLEIEMRYFNALPWRDGGFEFDFPLVVGPRFNPPGWSDRIEAHPQGTRATAATSVPYLAPGQDGGHRVEIEVEVDAGIPIRALASASHAVEVERLSDSRRRVRLAANDRVPDRDFRLRWELAGDRPEAGLVLHESEGGTFFSFLLVPPRELETIRRAPTEFVFVLDCSGSMKGAPLAKAKAAARRALRACDPRDSFQIIRFSSEASQLGSRPLPATSENLRRGLRYLDELEGTGGTMMVEGIKAALDFPRDPSRQRVVTFMTDGFIGNEVEIFGAIADRVGDARVFSFGIGNSVNRHLIEGMARLGRGAVAYVGLDDDGTAAVDAFYERVRRPALTDIRLDWGGARVEDLHPRTVPDLFHGRPVMLVGRLRGTPPSTVVVHGRAGGEEVSTSIALTPDAERRHSGIASIWARHRIADLEYAAAARGENRAAEVEAIALEFGIVSSRTSFLAVDASARTEGRMGVQVPVGVPVPDGVRYETSVPR